MMEKLKKIIKQYNQWDELKIYINRIEEHIDSDFSHALENAKSLLETIGKEICKSKNIEIGTKDSIQSVIKKAFCSIGYKGNNSATQVSSALATIAQNISELRNEIGPTAHGRSLEELKERNNKIDAMSKEILIDSTIMISCFLIKGFEINNSISIPSEILETIKKNTPTHITEEKNEIFLVNKFTVPAIQDKTEITIIDKPKEGYAIGSELNFSIIPEKYTKFQISGINQQQEKSLLLAAILGRWNENSIGDNEIINEFQVDYNMWVSDIREIKKSNNNVLSFRNGCWEVNDKFNTKEKYAMYLDNFYLEKIKVISSKVLSEINQLFVLNYKDISLSVKDHKNNKYSKEIKKGITETLLFLGVHGKNVNNYIRSKPEEIISSVIRELLRNADWRLWASLNDVLPLIAEAAPNDFLSSVEYGLRESPRQLSKLFEKENNKFLIYANNMGGLYSALECLAWKEEYCSRVILILAELANLASGGKSAISPINTIITILLPWYPQTTASIDIRIASIKGIQRKYPDIAWKILLELLPKKHQTSRDSYKPLLRKYMPDNWNDSVPREAYWEQVKKSSILIIEIVKTNIKYVFELVENLDNIPQPSFNDFLNYLSTDDIINLPDEQKVNIWETITLLVHKHKYYSDEKWALPKEKIELLEKTATKLKPSTHVYVYKHLFSDNYYNFIERNENWETYNDRMLKNRTDALKQIYIDDQLNVVILFAEKVENPVIVGDILANISSLETDAKILPLFLDKDEKYLELFVRGYVCTRYKQEGVKWIDGLNIFNWSNKQKSNFFLLVPFDDNLIDRIDEYLGDKVEEYWKKINVNPFVNNNQLTIDNLLKYNRPRYALVCIHAHYHSHKELFKEQAMQAILDGVSSEEHVGQLYFQQVNEIISILQNDSSVDENKLLEIEWVSLLDPDNFNEITPKTLEKHLSQNPDFFAEVIQIHAKSEIVKTYKYIKGNENNYYSAWKLLRNWKRPPGILDDVSFSETALFKWIEEVRKIEPEYLNLAMERVGHVLFYTASDSSGLWINQTVAELIEDDDNIRKGFYYEIFESQGSYWLDSSYSKIKVISENWLQRALDIELLGLVSFATMLKGVALEFKNEAERLSIFKKNNDADTMGIEL